jgi:hypothetical protein
MPESEVTKNRRSGILDIIVGANTYRVKWEEGDLQVNIPGRSVANYLDRGEFSDSDHGQPMVLYDQSQPMTGTFSAYLRDFTDDSYITLAEFITRTGLYLNSWGTVLTGQGTEAPQLVDLLFTMKGTAHGDAADHTMRFKWAHLTGAIAEGSPNKISINFQSFDNYPVCT